MTDRPRPATGPAPAATEGMRIVFAADSHLNKHYGRMTPDQLATRRDRLRAAWGQTVEYALEHGADVYIHGGDLFDGPNPRAVELMWVATQLQRLADAGTRVLLIGGNHDIPRTRHHGATPQRLFDAVRLARTFQRSTAVEWHVEERRGRRVAIGGLPPDPRLSPDEDPLALLTEPIAPPDADCVLLFTHYAIEGLLHPLAEEATITRASIAALAGTVDYLLVGHLHDGQEIDIGGVKVLFPGPTERMTFGELDVRPGFALLTVDGMRPCRLSSQRLSLDPQPMRRAVVRATEIPAADPTGFLIDVVRKLSVPDQILQLRLEGPLDRDTYRELSFLDVWHAGSERNFYFDLDRHGLTVAAGPDRVPSAGGARLSPRAEVARVADAMLGRTEDEEERMLLAEARRMALDALGTGTTVEGGE